VEPWEPTDDFTTIIKTLMDIRETLDELAEQVAVIRALLEEDDEEEAEED
jgi:hypothetical protein